MVRIVMIVVGCFGPQLNEEVVRTEQDGCSLELGKGWEFRVARGPHG